MQTATTSVPAHVASNEIDEELLRRITLRIVDALNPCRVILFGSYAYGTPHQDSDLDLFIELEAAVDGERPVKRSRRVREIVGESHVPMDILVRTSDEVRARLAAGDFFIADILEKGRVLYQNVPA